MGKPWLIRPAKESDCTVTDCGSHVKRVLTRSDGKVEKDIVTINEENGEVSFVEEGHDVERVTVILKNPYRYEIYQRNISDNMRVNEAAQEIIFRSVKGGVEGTEERVLALRT